MKTDMQNGSTLSYVLNYVGKNDGPTQVCANSINNGYIVF